MTFCFLLLTLHSSQEVSISVFMGGLFNSSDSLVRLACETVLNQRLSVLGLKVLWIAEGSFCTVCSPVLLTSFPVYSPFPFSVCLTSHLTEPSYILSRLFYDFYKHLESIQFWSAYSSVVPILSYWDTVVSQYIKTLHSILRIHAVFFSVSWVKVIIKP